MILCGSAAVCRETMTLYLEWTWNTETRRSLQADKTNWDSDCDCQVSKLSPFRLSLIVVVVYLHCRHLHFLATVQLVVGEPLVH